MSIPAGSEMFISCTARGMRKDTARGMRQEQEYLVEPLKRNHESMVKPAHSIVIPQLDKTLWTRVANASSQSDVLRKEEFVATLYPDVCVAYRGEKDGASQKVMRHRVGEDLTGDKRKELESQ